MADMAAEGWYKGSTHVHMNYAGNLHNSLDNLKAMSAAEDQDVVLEQIANKDNRILDYQYFVPGGGPHPVSEPDRLVVVGQEYRPPFYGHVYMFGLRDHLISPFTTLMSCGNSSIRVFRRTLPTRVTRGSFTVAHRALPLFSASTRILLNFNISNRRP